MRKPNHIVLDFENGKKLNSSQYWAINYLTQSEKTPSFFRNNNIFTKFTSNSDHLPTSTLLDTQQKFTIHSSSQHDADFLRSWEKEGLTKLFKPSNTQNAKTLKYLMKYSKHKSRDSYMYINLSTNQYNQRNMKYLLTKYNTTEHSLSSSHNTWFNIVNVNFLRKERLYTKLKYSRSPAFDIVSGGAAALLAAFIGFLISEKFGYELVDSGDFYFLFMYIVFASFALRPLITVSDASKGFWNTFSPKRVIGFYVNILQLILKLFK